MTDVNTWHLMHEGPFIAAMDIAPTEPKMVTVVCQNCGETHTWSTS